MSLAQVVIIVKDDSDNPLEGVKVTVTDEAQTVVYADLITDSEGECDPFAVENSSTYLVLLSHPFTTFTIPEEIVLDDSLEQEFILEGVYNDPSVPVPELCRIYGYLKHIDGSSWRHATVIIDNLWGVPSIDGALVLGKRTETSTDENGFFEIDVVRGVTARISVENTGFIVRVKVPNSAAVNLSDLMTEAEQEIPEVVRG